MAGDKALLKNAARVDVPTAFGPAALIVVENPFRALAVCLPRSPEADIPPAFRALPLGDPDHPLAVQTARMLQGYFLGEGNLEAPSWFDFTGVPELMRRVLLEVCRIPYGETRSYGEVAALAGKPGAARYVGGCMAGNPFPVFVPCHRVVRADGGLGGFGGGLELKRRMLAMEKGDGR